MAEVGEVGLPTSNCETLLQWHILNPEELPAHRAGSNSPAEGNLRRFKHHRLQFASSYIAALVGRHQTLSIRRMCASFILSQHGNVDMAGAIGHQFERLVHATLPNVPKCGAKLKLKMLATGVEFSLQLPPSSPRLFTATSEIPNLARADCSVYLMPTSGSYPAIDCLMSRKLLFQVRYRIWFAT